MTILRVYPAGWSIGEKLTSAQMNAVDTQLTWALDKRAGQSDTLGSLIRCTGIGRIAQRYAAGADADTTYLVSGNTYIDAAGLTNGRIYTLGNSNATAGDVVTIVNRSNFNLIVHDNGGTRLITLNKSFGDSGIISVGIHIPFSGESQWAEFLYTGSAWILWKSARQNALTQFLFTSDGQLVVPWSCTAMLAIACGGGGGGAAGDASRAANMNMCGGSGGGGAVERMVLLSGLIPGETLDITVGQGGGGGAAGAVPNGGGDGSDSKVVRDSDASVLATWLGAGGGTIGPDNFPYQSRSAFVIIGGNSTQAGTSVAQYSIAAGGPPFRSGGLAGAQSGHSDDPFFLQTNQLQQGGRGFSGSNGGVAEAASIFNAFFNLVRERGGSSPSGNFGGVCGAAGSFSGSAMGGGGGGGGGAGPYGVGGDGGDGRNGGSGTVGGNGSAPAANTGAGGGGGGASGCFGSSVNGGSGGNGAEGQVVLIPIR